VGRATVGLMMAMCSCEFLGYELRREFAMFDVCKPIDINENRCTMYSVLLERLIGGEVQRMRRGQLLANHNSGNSKF